MAFNFSETCENKASHFLILGDKSHRVSSISAQLLRKTLAIRLDEL